MNETNLDIDTDSKALQYRVIEHADGHRATLAPAYPGFPRTPDERAAIDAVESVYSSTPTGCLPVDETTFERLDASHGDVVPISAVAGARMSVIAEQLNEAFEPVLETFREVAETIADAFSDAFEETFENLEPAAEQDRQGSTVRDDALPGHIRNARERRTEQRREMYDELGEDRYGGVNDAE